MHPVFCKFFAVGRFTLGNLVLVMREHKVFSTCMNIDLVSQILFRHYGALDMPARTPLAPWGLPVRFSLFFRLPENKIRRVLFPFLSRHLNLPES